jgi:phage virion morphogenesis protein
MNLQITVQGQPDLTKRIDGLVTALDTQAILDEGAAVLFNRQRTRFLMEMDADGFKWPQSQAAKRRKKTARGGGTLFDTGRLFRSLQLYAIGPNVRAIGSNVPYGKTHNFGLAGFPVRQFLGFSDEDVQTMVNVVMKRIKRAFQKA